LPTSGSSATALAGLSNIAPLQELARRLINPTASFLTDITISSSSEHAQIPMVI
jgi:hypothetical protein